MHRCMDGSVDGFMDGRMDGWMGAWMDGWVDGWTDRHSRQGALLQQRYRRGKGGLTRGLVNRNKELLSLDV